MNRVKVEEVGASVRLIVINRPHRRNAVCSQTALDLQRIFTEFEADATARVAVITGEGQDAFSAGADVDDVPEFWRCVPTVGFQSEKPIVAAVAGWAVGGGLLLPMMCDLAVAADNAKFVYPEARIGLTQGMVAGLAGRIPHKIAMELMLLGRPMDARRAYEAGLVNRVVPVGEHIDTALQLASELAAMAPLVLAALKRFVTESVLPVGPTEQFGRMRRQMEVISSSDDIKEGFAAFKDKRAPVFKGR